MIIDYSVMITILDDYSVMIIILDDYSVMIIILDDDWKCDDNYVESLKASLFSWSGEVNG